MGMTFEEFSRIIREGLQEQLEEGISISLGQIKGNNGTVRTVLTLSRGKGGLSPGFDMRSLYEQYQEMGEDWEAMDQVLRSLREAGSGIERERAKREEIGDILDYEQWKESIVFRSVNTEKNRELLKERPGIPFLDLSLMFWVYRRTGTGAIVELYGDLAGDGFPAGGTGEAEYAPSAARKNHRDEETDGTAAVPNRGGGTGRLLPAEQCTRAVWSCGYCL